MVAAVISVLGMGVSFWVGVAFLGHAPGEVVRAIVATLAAAFLCLPAVLYAQRTPALRFLAGGTFRSWAMLSILYFAIQLGLCPWLAEPVVLVSMFVPLLMCTGLSIIFYGPIHDRIIKRASRSRP
jgi:hypothetical protein